MFVLVVLVVVFVLFSFFTIDVVSCYFHSLDWKRLMISSAEGR